MLGLFMTLWPGIIGEDFTAGDLGIGVFQFRLPYAWAEVAEVAGAVETLVADETGSFFKRVNRDVKD